MPPTQRISRETWKHHKADIVRLYIDEDQSIKSIQKVLNELGVPARQVSLYAIILLIN